MLQLNLENFKKKVNLTTKFGQRTKDEARHAGVDLAAPTGTPIPAFANGVVQAVGKAKNGMGNVVKMADEGGNTHLYGHLSGANVVPGQKVQKGQNIASMGKSGNSYSPSGGDPSHLDVRIVSAYGKWKNPLTYIKSFINK